MRIIGYARVSDKEQVKSGYSIDAQQETIQQWCADQQHTLVRVYIEPGRSGSKPSQEARPTFEQAVSLVCAGLADGMVVKWMDRFARNVEDFLRVRSQFYQAGKYLISIQEPLLNGDPGDPVARYISVAIMNAYQLQAELSGLKAAQGRERRAKQGQYPGTVPLGYKRVERAIVVDPEHAPMVIAAFAEFKSGAYTLDTWTVEAARRGYTTKREGKIAKSGWHRILRNKFYIGRYTWQGEEYSGDYALFIDEDTFNAVQEILDQHGTGESVRKNFWLLSGLLWSDVHACLMHGVLVKEKFAYYRAVRKGRPDHTIRADELESRVIDRLAGIRWNGERPYTLPEAWRLAFRMSVNMGQIYTYLETDQARRDLLRDIFFQRGIRIAAGGAIMAVDLLPGFVVKNGA